MSKRKPHNMHARMARSCRAVLSTNHVAVVNIDPSGRQGMVNWKNCKSIRPGQQIANAVCDYAHAWVIYLSALCIDQFGKRYIKSVEVAPQGVYRSDDLADVIEQSYRGLLDTCNPQHVVASGWIANPSGVSLDEEQAARVYDAVGAWKQQEVA
ncbi:hypothetical protein D9M70_568700 [compost metagenome]